MKIQTSELTGAALDWAVAEAAGYLSKQGGHWMVTLPYASVRMNFVPNSPRSSFSPSTRWAQGGPIIEREQLGVWFSEEVHDENGVVLREPCWYCEGCLTVDNGDEPYKCAVGPTPLIAAMRCYVASKLGDEVDIPEELK